MRLITVPLAALLACAPATVLGQPNTPSAASPAPAGPPPYGAPVTQQQARQALAAALTEAQRLGIGVAVAVVEPNGALVAFERTDGANYAAAEIALDKARSAAAFRLPTSTWDRAASQPGGSWVLGLRGAVPIEGGLPLVTGGRVVGAIGVSGGASDQDAAAARAGAAALG